MTITFGDRNRQHRRCGDKLPYYHKEPITMTCAPPITQRHEEIVGLLTEALRFQTSRDSGHVRSLTRVVARLSVRRSVQEAIAVSGLVDWPVKVPEELSWPICLRGIHTKMRRHEKRRVPSARVPLHALS